MPILLALLVLALSTSANAVVLCAKPRGDGTYSTTLKIRETCTAKEATLAPSALGLEPTVPDVSARVSGTADIQVPSDVLVFLAFDSERWDTAELHSGTHPTRLTAPSTGLYSIECRASWQTAPSGWRNLAIFLNGGALMLAADTESGSGDHHTETQVMTQWKLNAGDYVECGASQFPVPTAVIATNPPGLASTLEFGMTRVAP